MPQEKATQLYTGSHWRVEAATLADVEHFTKFAVSCLYLERMTSYIPSPASAL